MQFLIAIFTAIAEGERGLAAFKTISKVFGLNEAKITSVLKLLTKEEEQHLVKRFGKKMVENAKKSVKATDNNTGIPQTYVKSSWIEYISWVPKLNILTLKTKKSPKIYKLPFFPYRVAKAMTVNKSPGKTIWNGYWRVIGKGTVKNKLKNRIRVSSAEAPIKIVNKLVPSLTRPKKTKKGYSNKRIVLRGRVKTANIPKTGAKGIVIKIKRPKLGK